MPVLGFVVAMRQQFGFVWLGADDPAHLIGPGDLGRCVDLVSRYRSGIWSALGMRKGGGKGNRQREGKRFHLRSRGQVLNANTHNIMKFSTGTKVSRVQAPEKPAFVMIRHTGTT